MAEENPRRWNFMVVEVGMKDHIQEDGQQKNIIPDMIETTRNYPPHVILWADRLEASRIVPLPQLWLFAASRLQQVRHSSRWS